MKMEDLHVGQRVHFKHIRSGHEDDYVLTEVPLQGNTLGIRDAVMGVNDKGGQGLLFLDEISLLGD